MPELSHDPDREELREHYERSGDAPTDCWANYGDANPAPHGGNWIVYDPDRGHFELRGTFRAEELGFDVPEESLRHQYVYYNECRFDDLVAEDGTFTDSAQSTASSLSRTTGGPTGLIVDGRFTWFVAAYLDERRTAYGRHGNDSVYTGDYAEILDRVGVDPCPDDL